jgi:diguanylate cyclase (GGDEF)-like protein
MKILLVEDTRVMAAVLASRLNSFGHEVSIAENGRIAIEKFQSEMPELILMDIEMPEMNGFEATSRIRAIESTQQWAWTPIVFLTASDTSENLVTAIEAGGDDFMSKTVPETVLHAKMKAMSRIAALRQRLTVANSKLADQASRDGLTGLCNRRYMDLHLDEAWLIANQAAQPFGLLMLDVDNFKRYNDHYGHQSGDDCLRAVAAAVEQTVVASNSEGRTKGAFAARYGGEEFAVVLPKVTPDAYTRVANDILEAIRATRIPHERNADWGIVTASIGGLWLEAASGKIAALFRTADERLYKAKANGRNRAELN